ncbi:MAG: rod-binding protein, partial [Pirellulales bacterium]
QVRDAFTSFMGQTFFSQMIGAMRTSVGEAAYFHGGQAEEIFRGQLDQQLAEKMAETTRDQFGGPMFARQFPQLAETLAAHEAAAETTIDSSGLNRLSRR